VYADQELSGCGRGDGGGGGEGEGVGCGVEEDGALGGGEGGRHSVGSVEVLVSVQLSELRQILVSPLLVVIWLVGWLRL